MIINCCSFFIMRDVAMENYQRDFDDFDFFDDW